MPSRTRFRSASKYNSLPHGSPSPALPPNTAARESFAVAVKHHVANELDAAELAYRAAIAADASLAEAYNNLGVLVRPRDGEAAHELFERAVAVRPKYTEGLFNLGLSCMTRGDLAHSMRAFRAVLDIEPNHGRAWTELSSTLRGLGELEASLQASRRAVALLPDDAATHNNLGNALLQSGHLDDARLAYERALVIAPDYPEATNNLGTVYRGMRRPEKAVPLFLRALELKPGYLDAMHNLALGLPAGVPGAELIEARLRAEVARTPESPAPLAVLAVFLQETGRFSEARQFADIVVRSDERNVDGWTVLGICAAEMLDLEEAIRCYDRALEIDPSAGVVRWNRAIALLGLGRYEEGWKEYEARWTLVHMALDRRLVDRQEWTGSSLEGKTILVYTEQGLGDAIQFARFGAELKRRWTNVRVIVECDASLVSLFETCDWVEVAIGRGQERPAFDTHVALLSLPRLLGAPLNTLPTAPAFPATRRPIANRIQKRAGELHVGIVWGGRSPNPALARRSLPLELLSPLAAIPNVRLHSLQVGDQSGQLARCSFASRVDDLAPYIKDFVDTASAMRELDLVITIDTSVAHLAGAIGVPVWVMLIRNADWRWLLDRSDSPWYPSARLFRQPTPGDWQAVADEIAIALERLAAAASRSGSKEVISTTTPVADLPSRQRDLSGVPRFTLAVPLPLLADPTTFAAYALELTGDGVDAESRNFLDAEARAGDVIFDYSAGLGLTALGAATAPTAPTLVIAVTDSQAEANVVRDGAHRAAVDTRVVVHSREETIDLGVDALLGSQGLDANRVIVRVQHLGGVPELLPTAAEALTEGRIAAFIWTARGPAEGLLEWSDQLTLDGLTALGFEHFELGEDDQGVVLNSLGDAPTSRTIFSIIVGRFESEATTEDHEVGVPVIGMDWQIGATSGWGVYGQNLARRLLTTGAALPVPLVAPSLDGMTSATAEIISPALTTHAEFSAAVAERQGRTLQVPFTMLRALGNGIQIGATSAAVDAPRNVGVIFFESTDLDRGAIERAKRFDRIIAGSTWNAEVLRAHGIENVVTVLQGIDANVFRARPRKARRRDQFIVFSGGKLEYRKGQDLVAAAFREFVKRHPDAKLMIAWHNHWPQTMAEIATAGQVHGVPTIDGRGRPDMKHWLEQNGIPAASVIDLGLRAHTEMASLIADADVALFTNRAEGGTNLVAMECMASAVPTILSANTGHLDLVDDSRCFALRRQSACRSTPSFPGVDGWGESAVDEIVATLEQVHANPDDAACRAENAATWMRGLSWDAQIDKLYAAIADLT